MFDMKISEEKKTADQVLTLPRCKYFQHLDRMILVLLFLIYAAKS